MSILLIIGIVFLMYARTLEYKFIIDDHDHVKDPKDTTPKFWLRLWEHFYGIKVTNLPLAHAFSILVHSAVCCLIYLVFGKNNISLLTAILFAINPINNQCSIWLSGRAYAISTALLLMGMVIPITLPLFYGLANWWTINTLLAPLLFLKFKPHWFGLLLPLGFLLVSNKIKECRTAGVNRYKGATDVMAEISLRKLVIVFKTLGYYIWLCLFPMKVGMCHSYLSTFGLTKPETDKWFKVDAYFFLGVSVTLLVIANFFIKFPIPLFGLFWFVLFSLQWLNLIVISHLISERYVYLANIGLMYVLSSLIINTPLMWVFLTFYAVRLYYFIPAYKDLVSYWKSNTENFPDVAMGWNQVGLAQLQFGNTGSAMDSWIRGVQERPCDFRLNYNTANLLLGSGMTKDAVRFIKTAEDNLDPRNGYDFWKAKIEEQKAEVKRRGIEL